MEHPDYVEVYLNEDGTPSHVWVHFSEPYPHFVEAPMKVYAADSMGYWEAVTQSEDT